MYKLQTPCAHVVTPACDLDSHCQDPDHKRTSLAQEHMIAQIIALCNFNIPRIEILLFTSELGIR